MYPHAAHKTSPASKEIIVKKTFIVHGKISDWPLLGDHVSIKASNQQGVYAACVTPRGIANVALPSDSLAVGSTAVIGDSGTVTAVTDITTRGVMLGCVEMDIH